MGRLRVKLLTALKVMAAADYPCDICGEDDWDEVGGDDHLDIDSTSVGWECGNCGSKYNVEYQRVGELDLYEEHRNHEEE